MIFSRRNGFLILLLGLALSCSAFAQGSPYIGNLGYGCENWDCIWIVGGGFYEDSRVEIVSTDWSVQQTFYGPAWQISPPIVVYPDGDVITLQITDPALLSRFGWNGVYLRVLNNDWTSSEWAFVQSSPPSITSGGAECEDQYCVWLKGVFPADAYVDFRVPGGSDILPDAYTNLSVTSSGLSLHLNPGARYAFDTVGLNAWVVNPVLQNWSEPYYIPPVDRSIQGSIDSITQGNGKYYINGWACARTYAGSIDVHVYVGGSAWEGGTIIAGATANLPNQPLPDVCHSMGDHFMFSIAIPETAYQYANQPIYVHGISPFGLENSLIGNSGYFAVPNSPPPVDRSIQGWIDSLTQQNGQYYLNGWACAKTYAGSIDVHVYVGASAWQGGTMIGAASANLPNQPLPDICDSTGDHLTFSIPIPASAYQYANQPIYVHGISPFGLENSVLGNSGSFTIPAVPVITGIYPSYGVRASAVDVTLTGGNLSNATLSTSWPGLTFSNVTSGGNSSSMTATFNIAADANLGNPTVQVSTPIGSTTTQLFSITAPLTLTKEYIYLGSRVIATEAP